jgi:hypothetical protein
MGCTGCLPPFSTPQPPTNSARFSAGVSRELQAADLEVSHSFGGIAQIFSRDQLCVRVVIDDGLVLIGTRHTVNAKLAALAVGEETKIAACKRSARGHRNFVLNVSGAMGDDALLASQEAARLARECKQTRDALMAHRRQDHSNLADLETVSDTPLPQG